MLEAIKGQEKRASILCFSLLMLFDFRTNWQYSITESKAYIDVTLSGHDSL